MAVTFLLATRFLTLWASALAGLVASFGSVLVVHGSELRPYSLLALASVLFAFLLARVVEDPTRARLGGLAAVTVLGSLTHYFFLLTMAGGVLWLLVDRVPRSIRNSALGALLVGLVPLVLWSPAWLYQYLNGIFATSPRFSADRFADVVPSLLAPLPLVGTISWPLRATMTLVILAPVIPLVVRRGGEGRLVGLLVLVPLASVSVLAWTTGERVFNTRNLIAVAPFVAIGLAWGCASLPWRRASYLASAGLAGLVIAGFLHAGASLGRTPYDRIADELEVLGYRTDEPIIWIGSDGGFGPVGWYLNSGEGEHWPLLERSSASEGVCPSVAVVARSPAGRRWLARHRALVLGQASVPDFGDVPLGRRRTDLIVARLTWDEGILELPAPDSQQFLVHRAGAVSACLRP